MSRKLSEEQITELDNSTDKILGKIEDPERGALGSQEVLSLEMYNRARLLIS